MAVSAEQSDVPDIIERGKDWYIRKIRSLIESEPENVGKMVAIDADTGEFEVDSDLIAAVARLKARLPSAEPFAIRAGFPTAARIGAGSLREQMKS